MKLYRPLVDLNNVLLIPIMGCSNDNIPSTQEKYEEKIMEHEEKVEENLINLFSQLDINASVKADRYSLPYNNEIIVVLHGESYINAVYEYKRIARPIVKKILKKNLYKIRFYMFINVITSEVSTFNSSVEYCFRYYIKE